MNSVRGLYLREVNTPILSDKKTSRSKLPGFHAVTSYGACCNGIIPRDRQLTWKGPGFRALEIQSQWFGVGIFEQLIQRESFLKMYKHDAVEDAVSCLISGFNFDECFCHDGSSILKLM